MSQTMQALFQQGYDRERWLRYLRADVFPSFKPFSLPLPVADPHVEIFYHLGNAVTKDGKELGIYEVAVGANTQLARNRVQLRQMVAKALKSQALYGALAVYCDQSEQWRVSYISIEPYISDSGELGRKETSSKRYTYVLGQGAKIRTAISRFSALPQTPTLQDLSDAFSVEALNKEFYGKLHQWYRCAKPRVVFPNDEGVDQQAHTSTSLIRLLTRLLFVWFLKQKQLVNPGLFDRAALEQLIGWDEPSSYYKAILQNLFFATLNREINDRSFRSSGFSESNRKKDYQVSNVYRYKSLFQDRDPKKIIAHFAPTPFLNGGLFECLDREATEKEIKHYEQHKSVRNERLTIRIDGFSDRGDNPIKVPNELFFNKDERALGLIDLLDQYQFTIEESVSLDIEVALDPELMGLIFENLLADYNPETKDSARKSSGSFYTPRQIVSYMVDESVKAYLQPLFTSTDDTAAAKLTTLFSDLPPANLFDQQQTEALINAVDAIRILDPAVGSGAFPMGMLQRLIALLEFLDPKNEQFKQRQIDKADQIEDAESRAQAISNIKAIFSDKNANNNYGRKLYLIENCIFGVDIQSIAIQIAKLRFFISLAIEQTPTKDPEENYGIRALPNLETKFIVANSLMPLGVIPRQEDIFNGELTALKDQLAKTRNRYFNAKTRTTKNKYRDEDKKIRKDIVNILTGDNGADKAVCTIADKISNWNPYSPNTVANWFDPEWMFGVKKGFDIVIGNPPYIRHESIKEFKPQFKKEYQVFNGTADIYTYFYERGVSLLRENGHLCYITSNKWMRAKYGQKLRGFFKDKTQLKQIIDFAGAQIFENATVDTNILLCANSPRGYTNQIIYYAKQLPDHQHPLSTMPIADLSTAAYTLQPPDILTIKRKIEHIGTPLKQWDITINYGIKTGFNEAFIIDTATKQQLIAADPKSAAIIKPILRGRDIKAYEHRWAGLWLIFIPWHFPLHKDKSITGNSAKAEKAFQDQYPALYKHLLQYKQKLSKRNKAETGINYEWYAMQRCANTYYKKFEKEKIVYSEIVQKPQFYFDDKQYYVEATAFIISGDNIKFLIALMHSKLITYIFKIFYAGGGLGQEGYRYKKVFLEQLPIPKISPAEQRPYIDLVDQILSAKKANPETDTTALQAQIDQLVYQLYDLTDKEIAMIASPKR